MLRPQQVGKLGNMKRLGKYLRGHPLVWIIPLFVLVLFLGLLMYKIGQTPVSPIDYEL